MIETQAIDATDPASYVGEAVRQDVDHVGGLIEASQHPDRLDVDRLNELDLSAEFAGDDGDELENVREVIDAAEIALDELALCVETTTTFEIVLGTGGPDRRFLIECDRVEGGYRFEYEIRRVLYRYSWSGSAEREIVGTAADLVKAYALRVVPELAE